MLSVCARCGSHPALLTHRLLDPWRPRSTHCLPSQPVQGESHFLGCSIPPLTLLSQLLSLKSVVVPSSIRSPVVEDGAPSLCVSFSSIVVPRLLVALSSVDTLRLLLTLAVPQSFLPRVTRPTPTVGQEAGSLTNMLKGQDRAMYDQRCSFSCHFQIPLLIQTPNPSVASGDTKPLHCSCFPAQSPGRDSRRRECSRLVVGD